MSGSSIVKKIYNWKPFTNSPPVRRPKSSPVGKMTLEII
jgi:hypothetical protein